MNSIGAIEVKNALLKSSTQNSWELEDRAPARMTNRASEVRNGLQTVETTFATSVQTRLRTRSWVAGCREDSPAPNPSGACTERAFGPSRRTSRNDPGADFDPRS